MSEREERNGSTFLCESGEEEGRDGGGGERGEKEGRVQGLKRCLSDRGQQRERGSLGHTTGT